jgi:LEA14-like dessication related protein
MKKLILLSLCVLLISCTAVKERLAIKECKFSLLSVKPYDFTFNNMKLDFDIKAENPNNVNATLDRLAYTFYANNTDIFQGTTGKGLSIPAGKTNTFTTTVTLEYTKLGQAITEAIRLKTASYKVQATAYINTILGEISYPVTITLAQ